MPEPLRWGRIAADIGGTFTDIAFVGADGHLVTKKVPSTPDDYARAVVEGMSGLVAELGHMLCELNTVLHASTIATNAILEGKGAKTALITTKGFRDVLELRRIRVPRLYEPLYVKPAPLVPRRLRFEADERMGPDGSILKALDELALSETIAAIRGDGIESIAVCLLHSYANDAHERRIGELLHEALPDVYVSLSSELLPVIREYERTSTTVINAFVGPSVQRYLAKLGGDLKTRGYDGRTLMMQSSGGVMDAEIIQQKAALIVESGPAAGAIGAAKIAVRSGVRDVIALDMGGTTAKATLIEDGHLARTDEYEVGGGISLSSRLVKGGGYALKFPVIDISEVGAGGGSIAWLDLAGSLKVGPHSAGAVPGPACYGAGGEAPTVTDANVVLGYLNPTALAGGAIAIDAGRARRAIRDAIAEPLGIDTLRAAHAIHGVANAVMMRAVKSVSTYRGRDPRDFTLFAFGGNGGVHGAEIARLLGIGRIVVPPAAGVFSAVGLLLADMEAREAQGLLEPLDTVDPGRLVAAFEALEARVRGQIGGGAKGAVAFRREADLRYAGQAFEITVAVPEGVTGAKGLAALGAVFEAEYRKAYGHSLPEGSPIQLVSIRIVGVAETADATGFDVRHALAPAGETIRQACFDPDIGLIPTPVMARGDLLSGKRQGPLIVEEYEGTTVVPPNAAASLDSGGNIVIELKA